MLDPRTNVNFVQVRQLTSYFTPFTVTWHCLISIQKKEGYSIVTQCRVRRPAEIQASALF